MSDGSRLWTLTRPRELGSEWEADDLPKGFTGTIALDIDREAFMWALVWKPPAKFAQAWYEPAGDDGAQPYHEAIRPMKLHGKEVTLEDAREEVEKAFADMKQAVKMLRLDELVPPDGKVPKKAGRR